MNNFIDVKAIMKEHLYYSTRPVLTQNLAPLRFLYSSGNNNTNIVQYGC